MSTSSSAATLFGSTGLVGSNILTTLLATESYKPINTISRRAPKAESPNLHAVVEPDTTKWASSIQSSSDTTPAAGPPPRVVFSALGTTRAAAGGLANQWKIDHDLNIELAKAAKDAGVRTYVVVSSAGTRGFAASMAPYSKMKIGVEDAVRDLGFDQAVVLRPGTILGAREVSRPAEAAFQSAVRSLSRISIGWQDALGQDAEVIGRAAVRAAQLADEGKAPSKYWVLEQADIVRLGRDEWPGEGSKHKTSEEAANKSTQ